MKGNVNVMFPLSGGGSKIEGAVSYKGSVASASALPASPSRGDMYIASADFTLGTSKVESGDFLLYNGTGWDIVQGNIDNTYTGIGSIKERDISGNVVFDISFSLKKNGKPFNGYLGPFVETDTGSGGYLSGKQFNNGKCSWTIPSSDPLWGIIKNPAVRYIVLSIRENSSGYPPAFTFPIYLPSESISSGAQGFVTGNQVYDYVNTQLGDVQTLLEAL